MINAKPVAKTKKNLNSNTILLLLTIGLFVVMYAAGCIAYADKGFTKLQTFLDILKNNAGLICVTCGMTAVMITGGIDISVGAVIAMECMFLAVGVESWGLPAQLLIPLMLVIGVVFGIIQGYCVGYLGIQPFIVTMAGMFFARGMTAVISTQQVSITSSPLMTKLSTMKFNMPFEIGAYLNKKGKLMVPNVSIYVIIALLVLIATFLILRYTRFGRSLYAVGGNQQSAALMGLDVRRTRFNAHIFCSLLTSIGAICYVLNTMCGTTRQALGLEMDAISSAVIGGTLLTGGVGNVFGSFFGVLINGTISSLVKTNGKLSSSWPNVVTALLLCFFIVLQAIFAKVKARRN
ncbi:MAG: sugar ABC transporter permease YjfF [Candidatus Limiplasma sp.]|nr:sugar ABC transporter permease YjfF [Candidatus Limiplasma sp.]